MVLVDPSVPNQVDLVPQQPDLAADMTRAMATQTALVRRCAAGVRSGALKIGGPDPDGCLAYPPVYPTAVSDAMVRRDFEHPKRFETGASLAETSSATRSS